MAGSNNGGRKVGANWGLRLTAILSSAAVFVAFWQLAARTPFPANFGANNAVTPTPTDTFGIPTSGQGTPITLPGSPHSGTGLSH